MLFYKEVRVTRNIVRCQEIQQTLADAGIQCVVRTNSATNPGRYHGVPFSDAEMSYSYRILVKRKDYEAAMKLVG